jgi:NitT/TauT family transport system substrate-binding protein
MRVLFAIAVSIFAAGAIAQDKVRVATFPASSALPYYVALERGYFKEAGIEVETVPMSSHPFIVQAIVKGDIEAASNLVTLEGANINQRRPGTLAYVSLNGQNHIYIQEQFLVRKGHPANTLKDLKGTRLLSAPGPGNIGAARAVLKAVGLEEGKDFTIQEQQMGVHLAALQAGTFDGAYTLEPVASAMVKQGVAERVEAGVIATYLLGRKDAQAFAAGGALSGKFISDKPAVAERYARAFARGVADSLKDASVRPLLSKYMNVAPELAPTLPLTRFTMAKDLSAQDLADLQKFVDIGVEQKIVAGPIDAKSFLKSY